MHFFKYESIGNDFVLIDWAPSDIELFAKAVCDRKFGVGADGLLLIERDQSPCKMRMFNPDGTEDFCGNGLRCAGVHLWDGSDRQTISILHGGHLVNVSFTKGGWIDVALPPASFAPGDVPLSEGCAELFETPIQIAGNTINVSAISTGSTHSVISSKTEPSDELFKTVSAALEHDSRFPMRTSVIWSWNLDPQQIAIRIWERGVGETLGCGTGSAAAAAIVFRKHFALMAIGVKNPGGYAVVARGLKNALIVSARARLVYEADLLGENSGRTPGAAFNAVASTTRVQ